MDDKERQIIDFLTDCALTKVPYDIVLMQLQKEFELTESGAYFAIAVWVNAANQLCDALEGNMA